jgi:hypothetical protein
LRKFFLSDICWVIIDTNFFFSLGLDVDDADVAPVEHVEAPSAAAEAVSSSAMEID